MKNKRTTYQKSIIRRALKIMEAEARTDCEMLDSAEMSKDYFKLRLAGEEKEIFSVLFLDNRHRMIETRDMFTGTIDQAAVYPREIVKAVLELNAAAVVFAHNHPSGIAKPSDTDVSLTSKLVTALNTIDVRVLDHIIVGNPDVTSLAEEGLMP